VQTARSRGDRVLADPRVLGVGPFVEQLLIRDEGRLRRTHASVERGKQIEELIRRTCTSEGIELGELQFGGRRRSVAKVRAKLARQLVSDYGITLADAARRLGVSTSGIARILERAS